MDSPLVKHLARYLICRNITFNHYHEAILAITTDPSDWKELKVALFYLEFADWNVSEALLQKSLDIIDRAGPMIDANGAEIDNNVGNVRLERTLAKFGVDFNPSLCQIELLVDGKQHTFSYRRALNTNNLEDIAALNHWRHKIFRENLGRQKFCKPAGMTYHRLQEDYLLNRYSEQEIDYRGRGNYEAIIMDFNAIFDGVMLPGRYQPCQARSKNSITGLLTRKAINPSEASRRWPTQWNSIRRHAAAQDRIKQEWAERCQANNIKDVKGLAALKTGNNHERTDNNMIGNENPNKAE